MATIIRGSGEGKELSATYTFPSGNGATVDMGEDHSYRYANASNVYNKGVNAAHSAIGTCKRSEVTTAYGYDGKGSVIDTGNTTRRKAVLVGGGHSGSGRDGGCEASNNNSSWTRISTGFYTYRYYRAWSETTDESSSVSYGFCGVLDLGY